MDDQKQGTGSRRVRSVLLILVMLTLGVSLHAAISMRAIYPSEFYDRMMIGNGLMVTIEEATEYYSYLKVYDPSEPSDPQLLSSLYIYYREPRKPKLYRQHVYVPDQYGNRMRRYSLLNPAAPVLNYEYAFNMVGFRDMAFSGNYMLMSTQSLGLRIVNINSEGSASEVGHFTDNNPMFRVWASGDRAAVLSYDLNSEVGVLKLLDISNPASPYFSAVLEIPEYDYNDNIELVFHDHYLNVICDYTPTKVYDVSNMNAPVYLGEMEYGLTQTVYTNDYRICATGGAIHVQTLDDPLEPVDVASFDIQHNSYQHLQLDWPQLYLIGSEYSTNAYCLDLSDLNPPESLLFSYDTGNSVTSLTGWGQWLYSRDLIAELSPEGDIVEAISCPELSNVSRVRADEGLLQGIRTQVSECSLWNIGDTGELQLLSTIAGSANESIISGAYLFLRNSYGYSSYRCYDISDPSNPEFLFSLPEEYYSLAVSGNTFWVSSYLAIDAYSLDDPYLPVLIGSIPMGDAPHSFLPRLSYLNDHLYLSGYTNEIRVYDVSNPAAPAYVGHALLPLHYDAAEQAPRFSPEGELIVSTAHANQLIFYDLTDPASPEYRTHLDLPYKITETYCYLDRMFFKRGELIYALQIPEPSGIDDQVTPVPNDLISSYPNPFTESATILVDLSALRPEDAHPGELKIYNVRGQLIRSLSIDTQLQERQNVVWDGRDEHGTACSSGIYLLRLSSAGRSLATRRITLLRSM